MIELYTTWLRKYLAVFAALGLIGTFCVACESQPATTTGGNQQARSIKIGISLSLSGNFSADGQAFERGYQLWGSVKFNDAGQNIMAQAYLFQWQKGVFLPVYPVSVALELPKPNWP